MYHRDYALLFASFDAVHAFLVTYRQEVRAKAEFHEWADVATLAETELIAEEDDDELEEEEEEAEDHSEALGVPT